MSGGPVIAYGPPVADPSFRIRGPRKKIGGK